MPTGGREEPTARRGLRRRLARGAVVAFVINSGGVALAYAAQLVAARVLGGAGFGTYSVVLAAIAILSVLATLGLETGLLRFAAAYLSRRQWGALGGLLAWAERRVLGAGLGALLAGLLVLYLARGRWSTELRAALAIGLCAVPCLALARIRGAELKAFGRVAWGVLPLRVIGHAMTAAALGLAALLAPLPLPAPWGVAAFLLGAVFGLVVATVGWRRTAPHELAAAAPDESARAVWLETAWPLLLLAGAQMATARVDILLLGWLTGSESAGLFNAAQLTAQLLVFPLIAINALFEPTISALHARREHGNLQAMVASTSSWSALLALGLFLPLFLAGDQVLGLFGGGFEGAFGALRILLVGQLVNAAAGSVLPLLSMTGAQRLAVTITLATLAAKIAAGLVVIPRLGLDGAATVAASTLAGWNLLVGWAVWRTLRIRPGLLGLWR